MAEEEGEEYFHEAESMSQHEEQRVQALEGVIADVFTRISALKSAYIQLQAAHSPYNADKLRAADRLVIGELRKLSELKHMLKAKQLLMVGRDHRKLLEELKEKQVLIQSCEIQMQACEKELVYKNEEIERLKESLRRATTRSDKLEKRLNQFPAVNGLSASLFEQVAQSARMQAFSFAKMLIGLMKNAEWDLEAAAASIQPGIAYTTPIRTRFAFESYVCHRMFNGFENENFYLSGSLSSILDPGKHRHDCFVQFQEMRAIDPMELLSATPDCLFGKFCHKKYLQIMHERMEESFFGQLQHRNQVIGGEHPRSHFYRKFLELAKAVWLLHRLAFSLNPTASIFQVKKDTVFHPQFMESAVEEAEVEGEARPTVGFTIMPGFRLENSVFKCLVYLNDG